MRRNFLALITLCLLMVSGLCAGTLFEYDSAGNLAGQTDPLGRSERMTWHEQWELPLTRTGFDGGQWRWDYDTQGNLVSEQAPGNLQRQWACDEYGQTIAYTDERGGVSTQGHGPHGQLRWASDCSRRLTRFEYNGAGQLSERIDANGGRTRYAYDSASRLIARVAPDGISERVTRDAQGRIVGWQRGKDGLRASVVWRHDQAGQVIEQRQSAGQSAQWQRDSAGRIHTLIDGKGQPVRFEYDQADRLRAQTGMDGLRTEYEWNRQGLPIAITEAAGTPDAARTELERDALGRLTARRTAETITAYAYGPGEQISAIERRLRPADNPGAGAQPPFEQLPLIDRIQFSHDSAQRLIGENTTIWRIQQDGGWQLLSAPRQTALSHQTDELGNLTQTTLPGGQRLNYLYYGSGHLHQINIDGQLISDIGRDALHRETTRTQGAIDTQRQLDAAGRLLRHWSARASYGQRRALLSADSRGAANPQQRAALEWQALDNPRQSLGDVLLKGWRYDALGHLSQRRDTLLGEQSYQHDSSGRIQAIRASAPPNAYAWRGHAPVNAQEHFEWDAANNALPGWIGQSLQAGHLEGNRVRQWQDIDYDYDRRGRIIRKISGNRQDLRLRWNPENQLIASESNRPGTGIQKLRYHYDALGRRIGKSDRIGTTWFIWSGMRMIQQERGQRITTTVYEDQHSYAPLARIEHHKGQKEIGPQDIYYFHTDINGAPEELTCAQGHIVWKARYSAWGNAVREQWDQDYERYEGAQEQRQQNLRLQGQYLDTETGLHYNTFRYYDPDIGRFAKQDPIGLAGGLNL
ncbi:MAG: RHS domain-containing protein [Desulfovibrionaceae bacterium]|nr:RHS domain-containing protein [Desulfovibrionaceae bacterium]